MAVDEELVERAGKLKPGAVSELLQALAPGVYRLAYALCGRWNTGRGVARFVLNRSVKLMPKWEGKDDPSNWFHRFTIMTARQAGKDAPAAKQDVLVEQAIAVDSAYVAFISALRHLDTQQREALLLRHGEKLNERYMALAMDCSTQAAQTHLAAAEQSLKLVAAENYATLLGKLVDAYAHLTPDANQLLPSVNRVVFRRVQVRRWLSTLLTLGALALLGALAWGGWKLYQMIQT